MILILWFSDNNNNPSLSHIEWYFYLSSMMVINQVYKIMITCPSISTRSTLRSTTQLWSVTYRIDIVLPLAPISVLHLFSQVEFIMMLLAMIYFHQVQFLASSLFLWYNIEQSWSFCTSILLVIMIMLTSQSLYLWVNFHFLLIQVKSKRDTMLLQVIVLLHDPAYRQVLIYVLLHDSCLLPFELTSCCLLHRSFLASSLIICYINNHDSFYVCVVGDSDYYDVTLSALMSQFSFYFDSNPFKSCVVGSINSNPCLLRIALVIQLILVSSNIDYHYSCDDLVSQISSPCVKSNLLIQHQQSWSSCPSVLVAETITLNFFSSKSSHIYWITSTWWWSFYYSHPWFIIVFYLFISWFTNNWATIVTYILMH